MINRKQILKILKKILSFLSGFILIFATATFAYVILSSTKDQVVNIFGKSILHIVTGSMEPTILTGDYIIIDRKDTANLQIGDIISFYSEEENTKGLIVTHRIIDINENGEYVTKGDANNVTDVKNVRKSQIIGKYRKKARIFRWANSFMDKKKIILLIIMIAFIAIAIYELTSVIKLWKKVDGKSQEDLINEAKERIKKEAIEEYLSENDSKKNNDVSG